MRNGEVVPKVVDEAVVLDWVEAEEEEEAEDDADVGGLALACRHCPMDGWNCPFTHVACVLPLGTKLHGKVNGLKAISSPSIAKHADQSAGRVWAKRLPIRVLEPAIQRGHHAEEARHSLGG